MKKFLLSCLCFMFLFFLCHNSSHSVIENEVSLWPEIEPFQTNYLRVSDIHEIYYELCGNPEGKPVFVLHGGPGGSCSPYMRRFFNPDKFLIVLHDQRGAGKSKPYADIRENTTQYLVEDIELLRKHLNLGKIILLGGSWGSTLGLAYAESYPENVNGLVLRGIFTATQKEIDHFYHGGVRKFFPEVYDKFINSFPELRKQQLPQYLLSLIQSPDSTKKLKYSRIWAEYEIKVSRLEFSDDQVKNILDSSNPLAFGLLENYYMANGCFLKEGQLLNNAYKIKDIPSIIVNGRYDMVCPPITAYELHDRLPNSKLFIAESSGHWMGEKQIERELLKAMLKFE
jgi:proline iminopeptidase